MRILFVNDDGIDAPGIRILADAFCKGNDVYMAAPDSERSAFSHSLTVRGELTCVRVRGRAYEALAVSGTPADCVKFALLHWLKNEPPDIVISGINNGPNLGSDIMYSGTVAAACEAAYLGVPSVAVSLSYWGADDAKYKEAAVFLRENLPRFSAAKIPQGTVLNINYPAHAPYKGVKITKAGITLYSDRFTVVGDLSSFRLEGMPIAHDKNDSDCDVEWSKRGYATVTPIHLDRNDYATLQRLRTELKGE
ncbi:MAG: 5'/3'-nucleotidase SurE [Clostridiales bacterium]|jgi:5'-nucleotidase|nr:5'/3'-nucleotidase SurE [Clostridiales bacterium]